MKKAQPIKLTTKQRLEELRSYVALCFGMFGKEESTNAIAEAAGLHPSTIHRLSKGECSLATHYGTVQALGLAAGLRLTMTEQNVSLRISKTKRQRVA